MRHFITMPTVTAAVIAFSSAQAQVTRSACTTSAVDAKAVGQTVHAFYDAERVGDIPRWRALATPDFYMFHEGEIMPPTDFAKFIDRARQFQQKHHAIWTMDISDLKVSIDCTSAVTTQSLHNVEDAPSALTHPAYDETFLESFWLRKTPDGLWKIAFWHSTKVPKSALGSEKSK